MIVDAILIILQGIVYVLLLPLEVINFVVDIASSIPIVTSFLQIVAYIIPWGNLVPIFAFIFAMFAFRILIAIIKTLWDLLPIF